jgi:hypothetical protein
MRAARIDRDAAAALPGAAAVPTVRPLRRGGHASASFLTLGTQGHRLPPAARPQQGKDGWRGQGGGAGRVGAARRGLLFLASAVAEYAVRARPAIAADCGAQRHETTALPLQFGAVAVEQAAPGGVRRIAGVAASALIRSFVPAMHPFGESGIIGGSGLCRDCGNRKCSDKRCYGFGVLGCHAASRKRFACPTADRGRGGRGGS